MSTVYPAKLAELASDFESITSRNERAEMLIEMADRFAEVRVPSSLAVQPYDEANHVKFCESDAYVWAVNQPDGTQKYYFDVLNPQGLSAMALAVILDETLSGAPLREVAAVPHDVVLKIFGREVSMGKGQGLMGIIAQIQYEAKKQLGN
jgi:cysteine desulfuration protein SufE